MEGCRKGRSDVPGRLRSDVSVRNDKYGLVVAARRLEDGANIICDANGA